MRILNIILFVVLLYSGVGADDSLKVNDYPSEIIYLESLPSIGDYFPLDTEDSTMDMFSLMTSPAQFSPAIFISVDSIGYILCVDHLDSVCQISVHDTSFVTPEGVKIDMPYYEASKFASQKTSCSAGWGWVMPLPSGWNAAFFVGDSGTDNFPDSTHPVGWLFR
jgi:hypothetical protein